LPIESDRIRKLLLSLEPAQRTEVQDMLSTIIKVGLVEFAEAGSDETKKGTLQLGDQLSAQLEAWVSEGNKARDWFRMNSDILQPMDEYDLASLGIER